MAREPLPQSLSYAERGASPLPSQGRVPGGRSVYHTDNCRRFVKQVSWIGPARVAQLVEHATENRGVPSSILGPGTTPRIQKGRDWFARPFAFSEATEVLTANRLVHAKRSRRSSAAVVRCARRRSASPKSSAKVARSQ